LIFCKSLVWRPARLAAVTFPLTSLSRQVPTTYLSNDCRDTPPGIGVVILFPCAFPCVSPQPFFDDRLRILLSPLEAMCVLNRFFFAPLRPSPRTFGFQLHFFPQSCSDRNAFYSYPLSGQEGNRFPPPTLPKRPLRRRRVSSTFFFHSLPIAAQILRPKSILPYSNFRQGLRPNEVHPCVPSNCLLGELTTYAHRAARQCLKL